MFLEVLNPSPVLLIGPLKKLETYISLALPTFCDEQIKHRFQIRINCGLLEMKLTIDMSAKNVSIHVLDNIICNILTKFLTKKNHLGNFSYYMI